MPADRGGQVDGPLDTSLAEPLHRCRSEPVGQVLKVTAQRTACLSESAITVKQAPCLQPAHRLLPVLIAPASGRLDDLAGDGPGSDESHGCVKPAQPDADGG